ncbi:MAG: NYN domain-containing protein [Candidatus Portnoybacteria bacterium]|nr:NYN domain-containing protein [Candidatus Portnoybacteria bacterium]
MHDDNNPTLLLFVDIPNVGGRGITDIERINWSTFKQKLAPSCPTRHCRVYCTLPKQYYFKEAWPIYANLTVNGFTVVCDREGFGKSKDIDNLMITDLLDDTIVGFDSGKKMTLIIVSGDRDFTAPLRVLKAKAERHQIQLKIKVVSWKEQLSKVLKEMADEIVYLDTLLKFIDPTGYELSKNKKKNK